MPLDPENGTDRFILVGTGDGTFAVKDIYNALVNHDNIEKNDEWKMIWE